MARVEIFLDGQIEPIAVSDPATPCGNGAKCSRSATLSLDPGAWGSGAHTLHVVAKNEFGINGGTAAAAVATKDLTVSVGEPSLEGPEVIEFQEDPENALTDSETFVLHGQPELDGSCTFEHTLTLEPGAQVVAQNELARDPATCESLVERGIPVDSVAGEALGDESPVDIVETEPEESTEESTEPEAMRAGRVRKEVAGFVYHEDPAGINVTQLRDKVIWHPNARCANAGIERGKVHDNWYEPSGWSRFVRQSTGDANCERVKQVTNAIYTNTLFCVPWLETRVRYTPNRVKGFATGQGARHSWYQSAGGDCASWLSFHARFRRID